MSRLSATVCLVWPGAPWRKHSNDHLSQNAVIDCDINFSLHTTPGVVAVAFPVGYLIITEPSALNVKWTSGDDLVMDTKLTMQGDGNLVVRNSAGVALWASNTHTYPDAVLAVQDDGNLVIYPSDTDFHALWASGANC